MARFGLTIGISAAILIFLFAASWTSSAQPRLRSNYFPPGALREDAAADAEYDAWYTAQLRQMRIPGTAANSQPSLYEPPRGAPRHPQDYRALISHGGEYLIAIHAFIDSAGAQLFANEVDLRQDGHNRAIKKQLTNGEWGAILHQMPKTGIFTAHSSPAKYAGDCLDWVIEEREGTQYNVQSVSCPRDPEFLKLGQAFLDAAGWTAE